MEKRFSSSMNNSFSNGHSKCESNDKFSNCWKTPKLYQYEATTGGSKQNNSFSSGHSKCESSDKFSKLYQYEVTGGSKQALSFWTMPKQYQWNTDSEEKKQKK